jgi:hypothetical protein
VVVVALLSAALAACNSMETAVDVARLKEFGAKYTTAWCSQNAASIAAFFAEHGSLKFTAEPLPWAGGSSLPPLRAS